MGLMMRMGSPGRAAADAGDGGAEGGFVELVDVGAEAGLVGAVVDDDEGGLGVLELGLPGLGVEAVGEDGGAGSVEAEGVVEDAGVAGEEGFAEEADGTGRGLRSMVLVPAGRDGAVCQAGCGVSLSVEMVSRGVPLAEMAMDPALGLGLEGEFDGVRWGRWGS